MLLNLFQIKWIPGSHPQLNSRGCKSIMPRLQRPTTFFFFLLLWFGFDQDELSIVYKSYVRLVVEHAHVVWHSELTCKHSGDIEHIQRRACRAISGHQFTTYSESITRCNLIKLSDRRVDHCLSFAMGLEDNPRTRHLIPPTRIAVHGYNLWNANDLTQPMIKTKRYKQSLVPYFITMLNKH